MNELVAVLASVRVSQEASESTETLIPSCCHLRGKSVLLRVHIQLCYGFWQTCLEVCFLITVPDGEPKITPQLYFFHDPSFYCAFV